MRNLKLLLVLVLFCSPIFANPTCPGIDFSGLWMGVDRVDGGGSWRQFIRNAGCDSYELRGRDTTHGPCRVPEDPNYAQGEWAVITGQIDQIGGWAFVDGIWNLDCQAPPNDVSGDRDLLVRYFYDPNNQTLTEKLFLTNGEFTGRTPIVFYRVAPAVCM